MLLCVFIVSKGTVLLKLAIMYFYCIEKRCVTSQSLSINCTWHMALLLCPYSCPQMKSGRQQITENIIFFFFEDFQESFQRPLYCWIFFLHTLKLFAAELFLFYYLLKIHQSFFIIPVHFVLHCKCPRRGINKGLLFLHCSSSISRNGMKKYPEEEKN